MKPAHKPTPNSPKCPTSFVKDSLALSPVNASQAGYHKHTDPKTGKTIDLDAQLDDVGPQGLAAQEKFYSEWRTALPDRDAYRLARTRRTPPTSASSTTRSASTCLSSRQSRTTNTIPRSTLNCSATACSCRLRRNTRRRKSVVGDVISRIGQIPRFLDQAKSQLTDADPIFISTAVDENEGNLNLVDSVAAEIPAARR